MRFLKKVLRRIWQLPGHAVAETVDSLLWPNVLRLEGVRFGAGLRLFGRPWIVRDPSSEIEFGRNVHLYSRPYSNGFYLSRPCVIHAIQPGARIRIGDETAVSGIVVISEVSIDIGRRVQIGPEVIIMDSDFHPADPTLRAQRSSVGIVRRPVKIGDDVFIGAQAIIMKGVTIGDGALVAAGAVVLQNVKPREIVVGNPAHSVGILPTLRADGDKR
jgi:acetyltransferase-like isoleucine patch superfamily enzyme